MTENEMAESEIKPRDPGDPQATTRYKGRWYTYEEAQQLLAADNYRDMKKAVAGYGARQALHGVL